MLKKLVKYDMKFIGRIVPMVYLAALAVSLLLSVLIYVSSLNSSLVVLPILMAVPFFLVVGAISVSGFVMIAIRIYKNLYSDEGYLTFTLPVTVNQQIFSKVISGAIWEVLGLLMGLVCIAIPIATLYFTFTPGFQELYALFDYLIYTFKTMFIDEAVSAQMIALAVIFVLFALLSLFATPVTLLFAFTVGQSSKTHRVLTSMLMYFGINIALSTVSSIAQVLIEIPYMTSAAELDLSSTMAMYLSMFSVSTVIYVIYYAVSYFYVKKIMTNKLNLI